MKMTVKQAIDLIEAAGWVHIRSTGSHRHFKHPTKPGLVTIPFHGNKAILSDKLVRSIKQQAGLA